MLLICSHVCLHHNLVGQVPAVGEESEAPAGGLERGLLQVGLRVSDVSRNAGAKDEHQENTAAESFVGADLLNLC